MNITSVTLKNFKKFSNKTIDLNPGLSLLVGGNNEGKSSILHALAIWEFCKTFLLINKGRIGLQTKEHVDGVGMSIDDFTPINIPDLKYLWTNLKPHSSYSLAIRCDWSDENDKTINKYLEISLALANDRLFVKTTDSNIEKDDKLPTVAYLPPFAGISDKELWYYPAQRQKLIGQGLAGAVLRNTIIDMHQKNLEERQKLKAGKNKISSNGLRHLRQTDPFELLNAVIREVFSYQLYPQTFDPDFQQYVHVNIRKGICNDDKFDVCPDYKARDIMTEGSGFLQWLSVYTYALNNDIDILLLDEPDAHLHCSLQILLFSKLQRIISMNNKQILVATHSTEIIKSVPFSIVMDVNQCKCKYLKTPPQVVAILAGLGSEYNPMLANVTKTKRILFVENESDADILKIFAKTLEIDWPLQLTIWPTATKHNERQHMIEIIKGQIKDISAISLIDRDSSEYNSTKSDLKDKTYMDKSIDIEDGRKRIYLRFRKWRRAEIENYLLNKTVLARSAKISENDVDDFFKGKGLVLPNTDDFKKSDIQDNTRPLFELSGKEYLTCFCKEKHIDKYDIAKKFFKEEVCEDIVSILNEIQELCK